MQNAGDAPAFFLGGRVRRDSRPCVARTRPSAVAGAWPLIARAIAPAQRPVVPRVRAPCSVLRAPCSVLRAPCSAASMQAHAGHV
ncbi:hypothetical protein Y026_5523 [Burkholderia pseudomallei TSV28]|nr:hypothetical protein Y026_5523 [Burkholderia pseudomallei TSV28]